APGESEARSEVSIVSVVGLIAFLELVELRDFACERAGLEEVAWPGDSPEVIDNDERIAAVEREEGTLNLPTQTVIEREIRTHTPAILRENAEFFLAGAFKGISEIDVFSGPLNQTGVSVDGSDTTSQDGINALSVVEIGAGSAREIRGGEHGIRRVI